MLEKHHFLGVDAILASPRMRELFLQIRKAAQSNASILLLGESGSGREIVARAIHHFSDRQPKPFVDLSCAALPDDLVESELFGQERGAFHGAYAAKQGLLELAHEGSLFLDEIGALDNRLQSKLLRVLDTGTFYRLGAVKQSRANVRVVAATNYPLLDEIRKSNFREDLYHRIGQITLTIPPLRERPEDIEALAIHFLNQQNPEMRFASDAMMTLYAYHWPGNVRELRNTVLRSALMAKGPLLHADDIVFSLRSLEAARSQSCDFGIAGLEQALIRRALEESGGHRQRTADSLGISRSSLSRKIRTYGLAVASPSSRRFS
ncbi:MAG: sigma-54-dependent Fis family transcriptional regulator [Acidobacteria bacterium]|nr:sigma-54-dependent Fis family transcriptional regulator [Acidobacteriota bacterium]